MSLVPVTGMKTTHTHTIERVHPAAVLDWQRVRRTCFGSRSGTHYIQYNMNIPRNVSQQTTSAHCLYVYTCTHIIPNDLSVRPVAAAALSGTDLGSVFVCIATNFIAADADAANSKATRRDAATNNRHIILYIKATISHTKCVYT